ncbi:MAG: hypothetical protein QM642_08185 [Edaphocola sp.]
MKRLLPAALVFGVVAVAISCTKEYTCTCTSVQTDGTVTVVEKKAISGTKGGAEKKCKQFDNVLGNITTTCLLD